MHLRYLSNFPKRLSGENSNDFRLVEAKILQKWWKHGPYMAPTWASHGPYNRFFLDLNYIFNFLTNRPTQRQTQ